MSRLIFFVVMLGLASFVNASEHMKQLNIIYKTIRADLKDKSLTSKIEILLSLKEQYKDNPYAVELIPQLLAEEYASISRYTEAISQYEDAYPNSKEIFKDIDLEKYNAVDAIDTIVGMAEKHNILMINEAHHNPQHRVLTYNLLKQLKEKGYEYLAVEAFSKEGENYVFNDRVLKQAGVYIKEPIFVKLLLWAKQLGFTLVSYDTTPGSTPEERELNAANMIQQKIFDEDGDAKVIVHCGYSHISESGGWLAQKLKKLTGYDPLTIDQTKVIDTINKENVLYDSIVDKYKFDSPSILVNKEGTYWSIDESKYDISVVWPKTTMINGRPSWSILGRTSVDLSEDICDNQLPCIIEAYNSEVDDSLPIDRVAIYSGEGKVSLFATDEATIKVINHDGTHKYHSLAE